MENLKKVLNFLKSLFLPRQMVKHINMHFLLALLLLILSACLNIVTSNTIAPKKAEEMLAFPSLYEELPADFKVYDTNGDSLSNISINGSKEKVNVVIGGQNVEKETPYTHLSCDKDGVYTNSFEKDGKTIHVTIVVDDTAYSQEGSIEKPVIVNNFDLEGYLKQEKKENHEYLLYVFTLDAVYYLFGLDQLDADGNSTKAITNEYVFKCNSDGSLKYYLPDSEQELTLNAYGDFDTTKWTREVSKDDQLNFTITGEFSSQAKNIVPVTRHLENISNALYGDTYLYEHLEDNNFTFESINESISKFQSDFKDRIVEFNAGNIKTLSLFISIVINLVFPLFLSGITWLLSKSFYMNKFRQYFAVAALCFSMTTIISLIAGFFVLYTEMAFALLIIASVYFIVATFRINTLKKEEDDDNSNGDNNGAEKEPIKYSKYSEDTSIVG